MPDILVIGRPLDWIVKTLEADFRVVLAGTESEVLDAVAARSVEGIVCFGGGRVTADVLVACPAVRVVVNFGAGYDRIDLAACRSRGIALAYLPGQTAPCVADLAMGLVLAAGRSIVSGHHFVESGAWYQSRFPLTHRVSGRNLGIYGLGAVGTQIARRATGFDMQVGYHSRRKVKDVPYRYFSTLQELAAFATILVVCCPATTETNGSVSAEILRALGSNGILVNVARGSIVDEAALREALDSKHIAAAGLDVFVEEPTGAKAFAGRSNVVLTPHVAGGTEETWQDTVARMKENLSAFFQNGKVLDPIPTDS